MNPSKGLNNLVSPSLIDNREFSDLMNVEYDEGGVIRKRAGYVARGGALTAAKGLGVYATESSRVMVTVDGTALKYYNGVAWASATGATFTTGKETSFTQARLKLYVWNGTDGGAYFDSTNAVTRPGTMPKAKFSVYYQNKHICAGVDGQPSRLYISNLTDASDFTVTTGGTQPQPDSTTDAENGITNVPGATVFAGTPALSEANVIDIRKNDGDKITGLGVFKNLLIVFKERSIYQVSFATDGTPTVTPITYATGCVSHKSIKAVENDLYFLSRQGIRVIGNEAQYYDAIRTTVLSIKISPVIDSINKAYYSRANAEYFDNKYMLGVPTGSSTIDRVVVYDKRFQAYTVWSSFDAADMAVFINFTTNAESLFFIDTDGTQLYERVPGTYADNGAAIEAWVTGKAQDIGNPDLMKFWVDWRPIFRRLAGSATIKIYSDDNTLVGTATISNSSTRGMGRVGFGLYFLGSDGLTTTSTESFSDTPQSIGLNLDSRTINFKIYNNNVNENFVLLGFVYAYYPKSHFVFDSSRKIYL
jgi:hypothetical protein